MKATTRLLLLAALVSWAGCGDDEAAPKEGLLYGRLVDAVANGTPKAPGTISIDGQQVKTNEAGFFNVKVQADKNLLLRAEVPGYASTVKPVRAPSNSSAFVAISLLPFGATAKFDVAAGGAVETEGASVTFPAGAFEATGEVTASLARLDAGKDEQLAAFPGNFRTSDGKMLESFGAVAIEVRDSTGKLLNLKSGTTATVAIPATPNVTDTVPLWSFDETSGTWKQEGTLTGCTGTACNAEIPHLSWWNADQVQETTCLIVCAKSGTGSPASGVYLEARGVDYNGLSSGFAGADGCVCLDVRRESSVEIVGVTSGGVVGPTTLPTSAGQAQCGSKSCAKVDPPLTIETPKFQAILSWGENPSDLDSHFTGPCTDATSSSCDEGRFHISYTNRGELGELPFAFLDTDDTSSFGPEITTLTRCQAGVYRYSIHNYAGEGELQTSQASVLLLLPDGSLRTETVPNTNAENAKVWIVGELTCSANCACTWKTLNLFGSDTDPKTYHP